MINYYAALRVPKWATIDEIYQAYQSRLKVFSREQFSGSWRYASMMRNDIEAAYAVLGDRLQRRYYDALLVKSEQNGTAEEELHSESLQFHNDEMTVAEYRYVSRKVCNRYSD